MSDLQPVIVNGIGSPRAWLFTNGGEPLRDFDEKPIAKYLTKFSYSYNEEQDDECTITFMFPTLRSFDLPYFQQDVILNVEWGYITTNGMIIKSPRRKIAIRDIESNYRKDGIEITINCTDLVSYLKGMKTQRVNQYREERVGATTGSAAGDIRARGSKELEDIMIQGIIEGTGNQINVTKKEGNKTTVINKKGDKKVGIINPSTGRYQPQKEKPKWTGGYNRQQIQVREPKKREVKALKNLGNTTFDKAIRSRLYWDNQLDKLGKSGSMSSLDGSHGPKIKDSTDDNLVIKTRDFNQPIFKQYTYYGGSGELLSFKSRTDTRKNKENKTIASGVDPVKKKIINVQVDTADSNKIKTPADSKKAIQKGLAGAGGLDKELMQEVFDDYKKNYIKAMETLDPGVKSNKIYKRATGQRVRNGDPYMGYQPTKEVFNTYTTAEIINTPEFKEFAKGQRNQDLVGFTAGRGAGIRKVLTGYTIESIQRKYTASAEVIGDPTLIKGKLYMFNQLGRLDRGKWYATSVEHRIDIEGGYICNIELMKNPKPIGISAKTYSSNPKFDRKTDEITLEPEIQVEEGLIYEQQNEEKEYTQQDMDKIEQENQYRQESAVEGMVERMDFLKAEDDDFKNLIEGEEFKTNESVLNNKPKPNAHKM